MRTIRIPRVVPLGAVAAALAASSLGVLATGHPAGAAPAKPAAASAPTALSPGWYIDADTLHVDNAEEDDFWSDGDEPKIAVVGFRTKLGVPGSTQAWAVSDWRVICTGAEQGDNCTVPDSTGRAFFGNVNTPTLAQIVSGAGHPELVGTIQVTMEDDSTPDGTMTSILNTLVNATRTELAAASENLTVAQMADLGAVAGRFTSIGDRIQSRTELSFWQKIGIWFSSFGDPDDKVGYRVTLMVGVDSSMRDQVNLALLGAFFKPGSKVAAAVIEPRTLAQPHEASGVKYTVTERVFHV